MKKIVTTLILSIVLVVVLNNLIIAQLSAVRLSFVAVTNWPSLPLEQLCC